MNKTLAEALEYASTVQTSDDPSADRIQRFVIPPFTAVREVKALLSPMSIKVGAQNMHWADHGAWTGEISPMMLKDAPSTSLNSAIRSAVHISARPMRQSG